MDKKSRQIIATWVELILRWLAVSLLIIALIKSFAGIINNSFRPVTQAEKQYLHIRSPVHENPDIYDYYYFNE